MSQRPVDHNDTWRSCCCAHKEANKNRENNSTTLFDASGGTRHITDVTLDDQIHQVFFSVVVIIQDSVVVLTVVVGGEVRWGVVAPPSDLEGQDYVGSSRAVIYSTLPSTGLSGYPVGFAPSLLLVFWHLSKWFSVSVNTDLVNGKAGTGLHRHVQQRTHRQ